MIVQTSDAGVTDIAAHEERRARILAALIPHGEGEAVRHGGCDWIAEGL